MLCVCSEHHAGPASESETLGACKRFWDLGRGARQAEGLVLGGSMNVCVLVNLDSVECLLH